MQWPVVILLAALISTVSQSSHAQSTANLTQADSLGPAAPIISNPIKLTITKDSPSFDLPGVTGELTLAEAITIGEKNNLTLLQSEKSWLISKYMRRAALGRLGPSASFSTFFGSSSIDQMLFFPTDGVAAAPMQPITKGTSFHAMFAGVQPLFTGGRLLGGLRAARAQEGQSFQSLQADRLSVGLRIKEAYWQAALAEARLRVDTQYVNVKQQSAKNMRARLINGKAPRADYLREEAESARAQSQVNDDYRAFNTALLNLKAVMGINIASEISLKDTLEFIDTGGELANYLAKANSRPELAQAQSKISEMRARRMVALSKYAPQIFLYGLGSNASGRTPGEEETVRGRTGGTIGIIGGITLFDSGIRLNELKAANVAVKQAQIAKQETELRVAQEVAQAWIDLDLARRNVELGRAEVMSAEEDERLFRKRYEVGKSIALEVFEASVRLLQAKLSLVQAIYEYRIAEARMTRAIGRN